MIWHPLSHTSVALCIATLVVCIVDYITGIIRAVHHQEITSKLMKKGLLGKFVYLCIIVVCTCFDALGVSEAIGLPLDTTAICTSAIILVELSSIMENACEVNPQLANSPIGSIFNNTQPKHKG